jgi:hypothetical protein
MLDDKDIQKLLDVFLTRAGFRDAMREVASKEDINSLDSAMDAYAQRSETIMQETVMLG